VPNKNGSRLLVPLVASAVLALGCTASASADNLLGQIVPSFGQHRVQESGWTSFIRKLKQVLRRRTEQPTSPPSSGNGRNVPELSVEVAGAAIVLLVGGVIVLTSRRRRAKRSAS
jgi:hypothetical protein